MIKLISYFVTLGNFFSAEQAHSQPPVEKVAKVANDTISLIEKVKPLNTNPIALQVDRPLTDFSGHMWDCVDRQITQKGNIYKFKLKEEFDFVNTKDSEKISKSISLSEAATEEIFPSLEPDASIILGTDKKSLDYFKNNDELDEEIKRLARNKDFLVYSEFEELGVKIYVKDGGCYLELPDRNTLLLNWEKLQKKIPTLENLRIGTGEGIVNTLDFIKGCLENDVILAEGNGFIHDWTYHVIPNIRLKLESAYSEYPIFQLERTKIYGYIREKYLLLNSLDKNGKEYELFIHALAGAVDQLFAVSFHAFFCNYTETLFEEEMATVLTEKEWMKNKFDVMTPTQAMQLVKTGHIS